MENKAEIKVDQDLCIGCGMCINMCPGVFVYNEENLSTVKSDLTEFVNLQSVQEACEICPVNAITIKEQSMENGACEKLSVNTDLPR